MANKASPAEQQGNGIFSRGLLERPSPYINTSTYQKEKNRTSVDKPVRQPQRPPPLVFRPGTGTDAPDPEAKTRMARPLLTISLDASAPLPSRIHRMDSSSTTPLPNVQNTRTQHTPPGGAPAGKRLAVVGENGVPAPAARPLTELGRLLGPCHDARRLVRAAGIARPEVHARGPNRRRVRRPPQLPTLSQKRNGVGGRREDSTIISYCGKKNVFASYLKHHCR